MRLATDPPSRPPTWLRLTLIQAGALGLVVARFLTGGSPEDHVALLLGASCLASVVTVIGLRRPWSTSAVAGLASALCWLGVYRALVSHLDHPWLAGPETHRCDGPCFGWYTFEFDPPYRMLLIVSAAAVSIASAYVAWRDRR